ncbi:MAG: phage holin family protein [Candidatus Vogelbacteria bacterium]|nr:phage holin family protein [Candidatus Vogelbacteria bacterium]
MKIFTNWLISALAIVVTAYVLQGVSVANFWVALVLVVVLGVINVFVRPVLLILTLPINLITLGLFTFVLNALLIMFAGVIVPGFTVTNFWWALAFSLVLSLVNVFLGRLAK